MARNISKCGKLVSLILVFGLLAIGLVVFVETVKADLESTCGVTCSGFGRAVTILLTLSEPGEDGGPGPADYMDELLDNAVSWAGKDVPDMKVLVIRDDNHHDEWDEDTDNIYGTLDALGYDAELINEPGDGVQYSQLEGYDVVLLSNPGWPVDDLTTAESLEQFFDEGGGVILQGDDICDSLSVGVDLSGLTGLDHVDNGTEYYGHWTDNMAGEFYSVEITGAHPVVAGLEGVTFSYGDDIDTTTASGTGETVLALATVGDNPKKPVITAYEAPVTIDGLIACKERCFANGCIDNQGIANSLNKKLETAKAALDRGQTDTAVDILGAFINEVEAQSGKHISPRCAHLLIEYAERLIELLS